MRSFVNCDQWGEPWAKLELIGLFKFLKQTRRGLGFCRFA